MITNTSIFVHTKLMFEKINADKLGEQEIRNYDIVIKDKFPESSIPCDLHLKLRVWGKSYVIS